MKPIDVMASACIDFYIENNDKNPIFEDGDHVRISKYNFFFIIVYILNWTADVFCD